MAQPVKLATPLDTVTGPRSEERRRRERAQTWVVPVSLKKKEVLSAVSTLPSMSSPATDAANEPVPAAWLLAPDAGWLVNTSLLAVPGVILKRLALLGAV